MWPTSGTRTPISPAPPAPGDNQSTFSFPFDSDFSNYDLSIAASDKYVVACQYDRCKFLDKAGSQLPAKYSGTGEYSGGTVMLSSSGKGLFDPAVGKPGVSSAPVAGIGKKLRLRHLELQHTCDPELARADRNRCPTQAYDSGVTYNMSLQRFVVVSQFRYESGCGYSQRAISGDRHIADHRPQGRFLRLRRNRIQRARHATLLGAGGDGRHQLE